METLITLLQILLGGIIVYYSLGVLVTTIIILAIWASIKSYK